MASIAEANRGERAYDAIRAHYTDYVEVLMSWSNSSMTSWEALDPKEYSFNQYYRVKK